MGMTLVEKIIARHAVEGPRDSVRPGEIVSVNVDVVMANDITTPLAIQAFRELGAEKVFDPDRVMLVPSHFTPSKDIKAAIQNRTLEKFTREQNLTNAFKIGESGIEHVILPERGLVAPGDLVIGADSHTCTYGALALLSTGMGSTDVGVAMATGRTWLRVPETMKFVFEGERPEWITGKDLILYTIGQIGVSGALYRAMAFTGPAIESLSMEERLTMTNMVVEAGAKCGYVPFDDVTEAYVKDRAVRPYDVIESDADAQYHSVHTFDVSAMEPQVAQPYSPDNVAPLSAVTRDPVHQVFIGSCTNGRIEDLRVAAKVLERAGNTINAQTRVIVIPGSQAVYLQALREGLIEQFTLAGAVVSTSTCGPCLGGYMGILADDEVGVSTSNRNFRGRMGHPDAQVYLVSPAVAAATAVKGTLAHPDDV